MASGVGVAGASGHETDAREAVMSLLWLAVLWVPVLVAAVLLGTCVWHALDQWEQE